MRTSTERILTTHVGSLPRPKSLLSYLDAQDQGEPVNAGVVRVVFAAQLEQNMQRARR